jgi:hypothetical protein
MPTRLSAVPRLLSPAPELPDVTRTRIALFVFFQALYALTSSGNAFRLPDEFEVYFQSEHLIDGGDLSVPQATKIQRPIMAQGKMIGTESIFYGRVGLDGRPYAPYGPLLAVLALPHHLAGRGLAAMMGIPRAARGEGSAWVFFVSGITMLASATAAALAVVGFHCASIALGTHARTALLLSMLLGGATVLWPYGTSLFSEAFVAACFIWAAAFLIDARKAVRPAPRIAMAAALIVVAGLTKFTSLVVAPAFVAAILAERSIASARRRQIASIVVGAILLAAALHFGWNAYRFGLPFEFGYDWTRRIRVMPARVFAIDEMPRGVALLLLAPGKSLFVWAPMLVISLVNAGATWRRDRALAIGLLTAIVFGLVVYGGQLFPEGGFAHGPRHLVPIVPLLALAAAGPASRAHSKPVLYACAVVGVLLSLPATAVSYLEDQSFRFTRAGDPVPGYYEVIDAAPGRPRSRYRFAHIPFVTAVRAQGWISSPIIGLGPDYFFIHLQQAREDLHDGKAIPEALAGIWALVWFLTALTAAALVLHQYNALPYASQDHSGNRDPSASY